jgi:ubiquinone/menaquinone biosynthesis C-methylase UbiE
MTTSIQLTTAAPVDYEATRFSSEDRVDLHDASLRSLKLRRAIAGLPARPGLKMLELGCGEGAITRTLKAAYPQAEVHGCDISATQIRRAEEHGGGVHYRLCADKLPYEDQTFDAVFVLDVLEHLDSPAATLAEIGRILRQGGRFLLHCPCEGQPGTLHWFCWKTGICANLKRDVAGHVQRFTHRTLVQEVTHSGFVCDGKQYCYHLFGQCFDLLSFWRQFCRRKVDAGQGKWHHRVTATLPWYRLFPAMEKLAGIESSLLGWFTCAMGMDAAFTKK